MSIMVVFQTVGTRSVPRAGLTAKIHMATASERSVVAFSLSAGSAHDAPEGELLLDRVERLPVHSS